MCVAVKSKHYSQQHISDHSDRHHITAITCFNSYQDKVGVGRALQQGILASAGQHSPALNSAVSLYTGCLTLRTAANISVLHDMNVVYKVRNCNNTAGIVGGYYICCYLFIPSQVFRSLQVLHYIRLSPYYSSEPTQSLTSYNMALRLIHLRNLRVKFRSKYCSHFIFWHIYLQLTWHEVLFLCSVS